MFITIIGIIIIILIIIITIIIIIIGIIIIIIIMTIIIVIVIVVIIIIIIIIIIIMGRGLGSARPFGSQFSSGVSYIGYAYVILCNVLELVTLYKTCRNAYFVNGGLNPFGLDPPIWTPDP